MQQLMEMKKKCSRRFDGPMCLYLRGLNNNAHSAQTHSGILHNLQLEGIEWGADGDQHCSYPWRCTVDALQGLCQNYRRTTILVLFCEDFCAQIFVSLKFKSLS